jgi:hypothetical protein
MRALFVTRTGFLGSKVGSNWEYFFSPKRGLSCARSTKVLTAHNPKVGGSRYVAPTYYLPRREGSSDRSVSKRFSKWKWEQIAFVIKVHIMRRYTYI